MLIMLLECKRFRTSESPVAAIFDQLFQITEEDWGHSAQLPADFVVADKYRN